MSKKQAEVLSESRNWDSVCVAGAHHVLEHQLDNAHDVLKHLPRVHQLLHVVPAQTQTPATDRAIAAAVTQPRHVQQRRT